MAVECDMCSAQYEDGEHGDVVAFVSAAIYGDGHADCAIPKKDGTGDTAGNSPPAGNKCGNTGGQPKRGQSGQCAAAGGGLSGPCGDRGQQESDNDQAGIAPNHFMGVPIETGQFGRALIAEAPKQNGQRAVQRRQRIKRAESHCPNRMFEQGAHGGSLCFLLWEVVFIGQVV